MNIYEMLTWAMAAINLTCAIILVLEGNSMMSVIFSSIAVVLLNTMK